MRDDPEWTGLTKVGTGTKKRNHFPPTDKEKCDEAAQGDITMPDACVVLNITGKFYNGDLTDHVRAGLRHHSTSDPSKRQPELRKGATFTDETQSLLVSVLTKFPDIFGTMRRVGSSYQDPDDGETVWFPHHSHMQRYCEQIIDLEKKRMKDHKVLQSAKTLHRYDWRHEELVKPEEEDGDEIEAARIVRYKPISSCKLVVLYKYAVSANDSDEDGDRTRTKRRMATFWFSDIVAKAPQRAVEKRRGRDARDYIATDIDLEMLKAEVTERGFDRGAGILRVKRNSHVPGLPKYVVINGTDSNEAQLEAVIAQFLNMSTKMNNPDYVLS